MSTSEGTLSTAEREALSLMLGRALTHYPVDNARATLALRISPEVLPYVLEKRAAWKEWLTVEQRKWQGRTRRPTRARHHDSVETRERYVRCAR